VNPVVAVMLGWAMLGEPVTLQTFIAGGIILVAVALIVSARTPKEEPPAVKADAAAEVEDQRIPA
jgi:drug/metabolite transporter (DMT)-like permease